MWTIAVALLLGAALLWGSSRLVWTAQARDAGVRGIVLDTKIGDQVTGALIPLAVLALAGVAGMVATGGWARRVLSVVLIVTGAAICWVAVDGVHWNGYPAGAPVTQIVTGRGLALVAGILVIAAGVVGVRCARVMPRLGAQYSAPSVKKPPRDADAELWEALSEGEDPTTDR